MSMWSLRRLGHYAACLGVIGLPLMAHGEALPPPPAPGSVATEQDLPLHLELVINQHPTGRVVAVTRRAGHYLMVPADLGDMRLPERLKDDDLIDLTRLEGVEVAYDAPRQRLDVTLPSDWLPHQYLGESAAESTAALSSPGALFNYNLYASKAREGTTRSSLWHEARLFGMGGTWRTTGAFRRTLGEGHGGETDEGYLRYDTTWRYADQQRLLTYEAGDVITRPLGWTQAVRLGGIQVSRDFAIRPDLITYPLPAFSGTATVPTTLDLFVNGSRVERRDIDPGPFTLADIPTITGAGEATLITEDVQGRRVVTTLPFYATNELLRPGLSSFNASLGALRRRYGQRSFDYGEPAGSLSQRVGINDWLTLEGHAETADSLVLAGVGSTLGLWQAGTLELAYQHSEADLGSGDAHSLGYQYRGRRFSVGGRYERRGAGFVDLSDVAMYRTPEDTQTRAQLTASASLGEWGSVAGGYFDIDTGGTSRTRLVNLSYQRPLWRNAHLSLTANREIGDDWAGLLQVTVALGNGQGVASTGIERDAEGQAAQRLQYSRSAPLAGGWGWNLGVRHRDDRSTYRQADILRRGESATWRAGLHGSGDDDVYFSELSGSAVLMAGQGFLANEINDSFVVVSTDGEPEVPIRYENQVVGETDADGYLLVPWSTAYYPGKYEIDPLALPADIATPQVERRVAVESRSGYLLRFPLPRSTSASLQLVDADGKELPVGARVTVANGERSLVGWDGLIYLEALDGNTGLDVELPGGSRCRAEVTLPEGAEGRLRLGTVTCR